MPAMIVCTELVIREGDVSLVEFLIKPVKYLLLRWQYNLAILPYW
jgi:hypothetical protein